MVKWNDIENTDAVIKQHHERIAAFILEPILINGGGIAPDISYLRRIRELCTTYNIVLIYDEIITGLRVDSGGAQSRYGVIPDLTVLGKSISGGVPVSVLGGKKEFMELYADRRVIHAGTFNGYPLGMASVIATLKLLSDENFAFYSRAESYLTEMKKILQTACEQNDIEFSMSIFGSVGVFNCQQKAIRSPDDIDYQTTLRNSILFRTFPRFGILISPITRLFLNCQFDERDLEYFAERAGPAIRQCRTEINNVFG
jgi:glutamate-1-semialdehyde 2,1-aminomutase